jgi:hypothetical protein
MMLPSKWPSYDIGPPDIVHAIGAVSVAFNRLEWAMLQIFDHYMRSDPFVSFNVFEKFNNQSRVELLSQLLAVREPDPMAKEMFSHFLDGFERCAENRNIIMHSAYSGETDGKIMLMFKRPKKRS